MTNPRFPTTRWSIVMHAVQPDPAAGAALEQLCASYWYPLYAFVRRMGHPHPDAQDLVQSFFARFLEKRDWLVDRTRGRFRAFLLVAMRHFLANDADRRGAAKRGGGVRIVPIETDAEARFAAEPVDRATPELLFDRGVALRILDQALAALAAEQDQDGKGAAFRRLAPHLGPDADPPPYAELARELGTTEGALRVALHRLRRRHGELLRQTVADLVADPDDVDAEISALLAALST